MTLPRNFIILPPPLSSINLIFFFSLQHFEETLALALASNDELLHISLYDWLIEKGLTQQLLQVR